MPSKRATTKAVVIKTSEQFAAYDVIAKSLGKILKPGKNVLGQLVVYVAQKSESTEEKEENEDE